jgi:hypothetical protein
MAQAMLPPPMKAIRGACAPELGMKKFEVFMYGIVAF